MHRPRETLLSGLWGSCLVALVGLACNEVTSVPEANVRVEAGPPWVRDVEVTLPYPIELEADEAVAIVPVAVSGRLRKVLVDVGDKVKAGQLVALVDCREYAAQRTQAETSITKWEAQVNEARTRFDRLVSMGEGKLVAPAEVDRAQAEARVAEAQLADARAKLSEASQRHGYCSLTAPFDGYVIQRMLDPGAMVSPGGQAILNIAKTRAVRAVASIVEQDAPKVTRGAEVDVALHAFPDRLFRAHVTRVGRSLDPKTRTLRVEIDLPNAAEQLLPGMTGRAAIVVGKRDDALLVPVTAVSKLEESAYVYVVDAGDERPRARRAEVALGVDLGDWLEVREGIGGDDRVIMIGRDLVDDGTAVEVVDAVNRPRATPLAEPATPELRRISLDSADADADATDGEAAEGEAEVVEVPVVEEPAPAPEPAVGKRPRAAKKASPTATSTTAPAAAAPSASPPPTAPADAGAGAPEP